MLVIMSTADGRGWAVRQSSSRQVSGCAYLASFPILYVLYVAGNDVLESQEHGVRELMENGTQISINIPKSWGSRLGELVVIASVTNEEPIVFHDFANDDDDGQD